jgi:hypothetical protein
VALDVLTVYTRDSGVFTVKGLYNKISVVGKVYLIWIAVNIYSDKRPWLRVCFLYTQSDQQR